MLNAYSDSSSYSSSCFTLRFIFFFTLKVFFFVCFSYFICFWKRSTYCQNLVTETRRSLLFCNIMLKIWYRDYYARSRGSNCFGCSWIFHTLFSPGSRDKRHKYNTWFRSNIVLFLFRLIQIPTYHLLFWFAFMCVRLITKINI